MTTTGGHDHDEEPFGTTPLPTSLIATAAGHGASIKVNMNPSSSSSSAGSFQQPQTTQLAVYEATPNEECLNGSLVDVNQHFVVYAVKNGLIRVLHRHSTMRALLRGHAGQVVTDIRFFMDGDILGTVGSKPAGGGVSSVIIWRVFESSPSISCDKLLEIHTPDECPLTLKRLVWHPFDANLFWMMHDDSTDGSSSATRVETTRIQTRSGDDGNGVCIWHSPTCVMDGALKLKDTTTTTVAGDGSSLVSSKLTDLAWSSRDAGHVLTCNSNGNIVLWDLRQQSTSMSNGETGTGGDDDGFIVPKQLCSVEEGDSSWSRICFLPHEAPLALNGGSDVNLTTCFITGSNTNSVVTLWSSFTVSSIPTGGVPLTSQAVKPPVKLQVIQMDGGGPSSTSPSDPFSFVVDVCYGPAPSNAAAPSTFLLVGPRQPPPVIAGKGSNNPLLHAFHIRSQWNDSKTKPLLVGSDYVVPFSVKHPIYSWSVVCAPTQDIADTDDIIDGDGVGSSVVNENGDVGATNGDGFASTASSLSFDIKLFAYQSKAVQTLTLTPYMLLPPEHAFPQDFEQKGLPNGIVSVEPLTGKYSLSSISNTAVDGNDGSDDGAVGIVTSFDEEEYDVDDDDEEDDEDDVDQPTTAPSASALPVLGGIGGAGSLTSPFGGSSGGNAFANWLGAIANTGNPPQSTVASSSPAPVVEENLPIPPPPPPPSTPATGMLPPKPISEVDVLPPLPPSLQPEADSNSTYVNPMDFLKRIGAGDQKDDSNDEKDSKNKTGNNSKPQSRSQTPSKGGKGKGRGKSPKRSKSPKSKKQQQAGTGKGSFLDGKVTILKRDENPTVDKPNPTVASTVPAPPLPPDPSVLTDPALLAAAAIPVDGTALIPSPPPAPLANPSSVALDQDMIDASISKAVDDALSKKMIPAVNKAVQESFATLARPLRSSMDNLSKKGVTVDPSHLKAALDVQTPLKAALAENMRHVLVPALESISSQVLQQIQTSMPPPPPDNTKTLESLTQQLSAMASKLDSLANEVQLLRRQASERPTLAATAQQAGTGVVPPPPPQPDPVAVQMEQIRQEIQQLVAQGSFEAAFTKAVSVTSTEMTLFACRISDINKVLGAATPAISQPIVLCLMQQLGAALTTTSDPRDLLMIVSWLQELTLSLNTSDPKIKNHIPGVLQQIITNVNAKAAAEQQQGSNPQLRRPLQMLMQVLRGMQMG